MISHNSKFGRAAMFGSDQYDRHLHEEIDAIWDSVDTECWKKGDEANLRSSLDFYVSIQSTATTSKIIRVEGKGKIVVEAITTGGNVVTSEYWLSEGKQTAITHEYGGAKKVRIYGNVTDLNCCNQNITSLDVSHNPALKQLDCSYNQLTSLDLSHNPSLLYLDCFSNQLASLDLSHNPNLMWLDCHSNNLTSLDLSHNTTMDYLSCNNNQISELDLSHNTALTYLECSSNNLTSLDVSNNSAMTGLYCSSNNITSLDVSNNSALTGFGCSSNKLTSLDISHNPALLSLNCNGNQLTSLCLYPTLGDEDEDEVCLYVYGNPIWNTELDSIIAALPNMSDYGGDSYFYYNYDAEGEDEGAIYNLTESQISALEAKGWTAENNY